MEIVSFHCRQAVILGTAGLLLFLAYAWWHFGWFWASDTFSVWVLSVLLALLYVVLLGSPTQWIVRTSGRLVVILTGAITGSFGVVIAIALLSKYSFTLEGHISKYWLYHAIFGLIGAAHGNMFQNWFLSRAAAQSVQRRGV